MIIIIKIKITISRMTYDNYNNNNFFFGSLLNKGLGLIISQTTLNNLAVLLLTFFIIQGLLPNVMH